MSKSPEEMALLYDRFCYARLRQLEQIDRPLRTEQDRAEIEGLLGELRARHPGAF